MKILKSKKAEGYIDICISVIVLLSFVVLSLNIYSFMILKQDMDEISEQLINIASYTGSFGDEFNERVEELKEQYFDFTVTTDADGFYNSTYKRVQLGKTMKVTVTVNTKVVGVGNINIPVTCKSVRSGISEKYWKG